MITGAKFAVGALGLLLAFSQVNAQNDWPQWRGADRTDISKEKGLLKEWPAGGPELKWKATDIGTGFSGISVSKGKIYTMGDVEGSCQLMALEESTGKKIWTAKVGDVGGGGGYPGPRCTPAVEDGLVFAIGQFGDLVCADASTGKEVWRKNLVKDFGGKTPHWGYAESPLVKDGKVFCVPGGKEGSIVALNAKTGATEWRSKEYTDEPHYTSLIVETISGDKQLIHLSSANVVGVDIKDGKVLWKASRQGKTAVVPTPVYADGILYVTSGYGVGCNAFKITKEANGFKAEQIYANTDMVDHHGGVILLDGYVYGHSDSKGWVCMDVKTGQLAWSNKGVGKGAIGYADGCFYIRSEGGKGTIALIEANPKAYVEKGRFDQPDRSDKNSWPHPVIVNGNLLIRDQGVLLCYNVKGK